MANKGTVKIVVLFLIVVGGAFALSSDSKIQSAYYNPTDSMLMEGALEPNNLLKKADWLAKNKIAGPEDTAIKHDKTVYAGLSDGRVIYIDQKGAVGTLVNTGGRPLGMEWHPNGNLIVADAKKGLLAISPEGEIFTLATEAEGGPFRFTDDVDIAQDGSIYFSDASSKYSLTNFKLDGLEARPWGRLMRYTPSTGKTEVLLKDLFCANGVALSADETFVLVSETWRYRVTRYWLKGPKKGTSDIFIDNLPGFPDGISSTDRGTFWLALASKRSVLVDTMHQFPTLKDAAAKLPKSLMPEVSKYGFVIAIDNSGQIISSLHDQDGNHLHEITSVEEFKGTLYLGSLRNDVIGKIDTPIVSTH